MESLIEKAAKAALESQVTCTAAYPKTGDVRSFTFKLSIFKGKTKAEREPVLDDADKDEIYRTFIVPILTNKYKITDDSRIESVEFSYAPEHRWYTSSKVLQVRVLYRLSPSEIKARDKDKRLKAERRAKQEEARRRDRLRWEVSEHLTQLLMIAGGINRRPPVTLEHDGLEDLSNEDIETFERGIKIIDEFLAPYRVALKKVREHAQEDQGTQSSNEDV